MVAPPSFVHLYGDTRISTRVSTGGSVVNLSSRSLDSLVPTKRNICSNYDRFFEVVSSECGFRRGRLDTSFKTEHTCPNWKGLISVSLPNPSFFSIHVSNFSNHTSDSPRFSNPKLPGPKKTPPTTPNDRRSSRWSWNIGLVSFRAEEAWELSTKKVVG